ncbi:MAG: 4-amino-4-deoxychorismate lyase [Rhodobacterales bacterium]|nr:4-amino-4-deoxychorismate lyase [Rhodobacterales bacterium]
MESPFRDPVPHGTRIIETLGWWPDSGAPDAPAHLARMGRTAAALGYPLDRAKAQALLALSADAPLRVRLTLGAQGDMACETAPLPPAAPVWRLALAVARLDPADIWLRHKTTQRGIYDRARAALPAGVDEWLFLNSRDEVCEGTITTIFVQTADGAHVTPPLACGLLPGILRARLLAQGWQERVLDMGDLARARQIWVGNALRGLIPAQLVTPGSAGVA